MEFFDKLGKKATEAYKITTDATSKIAKEAKIKLKKSDLESQIEDIYQEIGERIYKKYQQNEDYNIEKELEEQLINIDILKEEIEDLTKTTLELKNKKQCKKCHQEIDKEDKYCKNCGQKQEEEKFQENNSLYVQENKDENQEQDNLEKTIKIESNVEE